MFYAMSKNIHLIVCLITIMSSNAKIESRLILLKAFIKAYIALIEEYGWRDITVLYQDNNALIRLKVGKINFTIIYKSNIKFEYKNRDITYRGALIPITKFV